MSANAIKSWRADLPLKICVKNARTAWRGEAGDAGNRTALATITIQMIHWSDLLRNCIRWVISVLFAVARIPLSSSSKRIASFLESFHSGANNILRRHYSQVLFHVRTSRLGFQNQPTIRPSTLTSSNRNDDDQIIIILKLRQTRDIKIIYDTEFHSEHIRQ